MKKILLNAFAFMFATIFLQIPNFAHANEETVGEKVSETASDAGKTVKKGARAVKDKSCHMVKGKMQCAGEKVKHKAQNAADEIEDKVEDVKK